MSRLANPITVYALDGCLVNQSPVTHTTLPIKLVNSTQSFRIYSILFSSTLPTSISPWHHLFVIDWESARLLSWSSACFTTWISHLVQVNTTCFPWHAQSVYSKIFSTHRSLSYGPSLFARPWIVCQEEMLVSQKGTLISWLLYSGVNMEEKKVSTVSEWLEPMFEKEHQCFLGFPNFYLRFIQGFSTVAQLAFSKLKNIFVSTPILKWPDPEKPFIVEVDTSAVGLGAVLSQRQTIKKI